MACSKTVHDTSNTTFFSCDPWKRTADAPGHNWAQKCLVKDIGKTVHITNKAVIETWPAPREVTLARKVLPAHGLG